MSIQFFPFLRLEHEVYIIHDKNTNLDQCLSALNLNEIIVTIMWKLLQRV